MAALLVFYRSCTGAAALCVMHARWSILSLVAWTTLAIIALVTLTTFAITAWSLWPPLAARELRAAVTRFSDYGPQRRIIVINVWDPGYGQIDTLEIVRKARLKVKGVWVPAEASSDALIIPVDVEACQLVARWRPGPPARRVAASFARLGLQRGFPRMCSWVAGRFSNESGHWRQVEVKVILPANLSLPGCHEAMHNSCMSGCADCAAVCDGASSAAHCSALRSGKV